MYVDLFEELFECTGAKNRFVSTKPGTKEDYKARFKNHNLPILQYVYMGDTGTELACTVNHTPAFAEFPCIVQKKPLTRFRMEFNHIRQLAAEGRQAGSSVDKHETYGPADLFRSRPLDDPKYAVDLVEFMTMMPVDADAHKWITQSSAYGNITLVDFAQANWPWHLQTKTNFDSVCDQYALDFLDYDQFIDHLSDIRYPPVRQRLYQSVTDDYRLTWSWR